MYVHVLQRYIQRVRGQSDDSCTCCARRHAGGTRDGTVCTPRLLFVGVDARHRSYIYTALYTRASFFSHNLSMIHTWYIRSRTTGPCAHVSAATQQRLSPFGGQNECILRRLVCLCALEVMWQHPCGRTVIETALVYCCQRSCCLESDFCTICPLFARKQSHTHVETSEGGVKGMRATQERCGVKTYQKIWWITEPRGPGVSGHRLILAPSLPGGEAQVQFAAPRLSGRFFNGGNHSRLALEERGWLRNREEQGSTERP